MPDTLEAPSLSSAFALANSGGAEGAAPAPPANDAPGYAAPPPAEPFTAPPFTPRTEGAPDAPAAPTADAPPAAAPEPPAPPPDVAALRAELDALKADQARQNDAAAQRDRQAQAEQRAGRVAQSVYEQRAPDYQARIEAGELTVEQAEQQLRAEIGLAQREDRITATEQDFAVQRFEQDMASALARPEYRDVPATFARAYAAVMPLPEALAAAAKDVRQIQDAAVTAYEHRRAQAPPVAPLRGGGPQGPSAPPLDPRKISLSQALAMGNARS